MGTSLQALSKRLGRAVVAHRHSASPDPLVEAGREATYPPPYPEGWYVVARSDDLGPKPKFVAAVGRQWAVFRGDSGRAHCVDAYCPHLGANLADGAVHGEFIRCPFHGWQIRGDGAVLGRTEPAPACPAPEHRTRAWATEELYGWVFVYHRHFDLEPGPPPEPPFRVERLPEVDDGRLVWRGEYDAGNVHMHLLEFIENSVDFQHFEAIHGRLRLPWTEIPVPGMTIHHEATWHRDLDQRHVAWFENDAVLAFRGHVIKGSGAHAKVRLDGPGSIVRFDFRLHRGRGRVVMFQSHTPIAPLTQHIRFRWFSEPQVPRALASFVVGNWISQWRQDIGIWERKVYRESPLLTRGDGPIHQLRRWYAQFYPQPKVEERAPPNAPL